MEASRIWPEIGVAGLLFTDEEEARETRYSAD